MLIKQMFAQMISATSLSLSCREGVSYGLTADLLWTLLSWFWMGSRYCAGYQSRRGALTFHRVPLVFGMSMLAFKNSFNLKFFYLRILYLCTVFTSFCQSGTQLSVSRGSCDSHRNLTPLFIAPNLTPFMTKPGIPPQLTSDPASLSPLRLPIWAMAFLLDPPSAPLPVFWALISAELSVTWHRF